MWKSVAQGVPFSESRTWCRKGKVGTTLETEDKKKIMNANMGSHRKTSLSSKVLVTYCSACKALPLSQTNNNYFELKSLCDLKNQKGWLLPGIGTCGDIKHPAPFLKILPSLILFFQLEPVIKVKLDNVFLNASRILKVKHLVSKCSLWVTNLFIYLFSCKQPEWWHKECTQDINNTHRPCPGAVLHQTEP